jgi:hypothetical protein
MHASLLTFDEPTHTYRLLDVVVPGVTQILQPLVDFSHIRPDVLETKRDLGKRVHLACQLDDEGDLDEESIEADVAPYLAGWRAFLRDSGARVVENERQVLEPFLLYAGTLDNVLSIDRVRWVVDKKTSFDVPMSAGPQTAAYMRALGDPSVTHRAAVRLRPDGRYRFDAFTGSDDWSVFMSCLTLHRFKERHANA